LLAIRHRSLRGPEPLTLWLIFKLRMQHGRVAPGHTVCLNDAQ
jgi:hypothetical protein